MNTFRCIAIPTSIAESVRSTLASPFAEHPAHIEIAKGHGPCRHCLRTFHVGAEKRILFTLDPFAELGVPPLPGPVFIHADECDRYPEDGEFPNDLRQHLLVFNAYSRERRLLAEELATGRDIELTIDRLLAQAEVEYLHVRDLEAGCYDLRVERVEAAVTEGPVEQECSC
ncbi:MAG: DUF1203 domain-containing protein [bacterium]|nr:DUF1203 domain-containing protein [bacterium]